MWLSLLSVLANKRQAVWDTDLKAVRGGSSVRQTGLLLGDPLFSKELENMGRQLAGRHYSCVVWHVCVCCVCVCQPLLIMRTGKPDQMEFWKVKARAQREVPCEGAALHSMGSSFLLRLNKKMMNFPGIRPKSHFSLGMASVPHLRMVYFYVCL